ncbi:MAG: hypothetical protein DPW09_16985 [Anaerolineae bacterium]|nr:hypothetical protein [Anaerolineales bacterium]MCQ3975138.1 hypothetical protein [Anaerolineae bacterium]
MNISYLNTKGIIAIITVVMLAACQGQPTSSADRGESHYFVETGHTVRGDFWHFFNVYGGVESLGYPLTEEIVANGWTVQYFEKGRLERHPENEPAYRITVGWLGDLLQRRRPPLPPQLIPRADDPNRRYFPESGHTASGDFLRYFDTHGGTVRFGLPISEPFLEAGRLTQDFQSARFFWTPEGNPPVMLEEIGRVYWELSQVDNNLAEDKGEAEKNK